ncbi:MAG TPA: glucosamine-6-phosphate deaminase [Candidatus Saccharimonadales bacterium]|nr:glucosamine-6-phosphate deaminase [Candidatus Saccharimonadales bacterium]
MIKIFRNSSELGRAVADSAAEILRDTIAKQDKARIIAATGASQIAFLKELTAFPGIDWRRVEMFHLDEYVGLPITHGASFRKYLLERLIKPAGIGQYHLLDGEGDVAAVCRRVGIELNAAPINVAFVGIGENGHLAFNDPPADFTTEEPYLIVNLDAACRRQQVGEGWFKHLSEVPQQAISMSIRQILKARKILCIVPDRRKAQAVRACLEGEISPAAPASILQTHPDVTFYLDKDSSSLLGRQILAEATRP